MEKESPTLILATYLSKLRYEDLPQNVIEHSKLCILDSIGCGLFGNDQACVKILSAYIDQLGGGAEATAWYGRKKTSVQNAVLINGTACHSFELDDLHTNAILHTGSVVVPVALAMAEKHKLSAQDFILAVVAGYEAGCRVGMAAGGRAHFSRGFHIQGTIGTFAAAATAAKALKLSPEQTVHALGLAGSQAAGLMAAQYGAMAKRLHSGKAAANGVNAAELAVLGFTGITDIFEAEFGGFLSSHSDEVDLEKITAGLGSEFELLRTGFKIYSCCASNQTSVGAIKAFMDKGLKYEDVKKISARVSTMTYDHVGWEYNPEAIVTAQMNLPFTLAVTMRDGDCFINQYTEETIHDLELCEFARKVFVEADAEIDKLGNAFRHTAIVKVETNDGTIYEQRVDNRKGSDLNPVAKQELIAKFKILCAKALTDEEAEQVIDIVFAIEEKGKLDSLLHILE